MGQPGALRARSRVRAELLRTGLLPFSDTRVPSLVTIVAGAPVSGSWWGHPAGPLIYEVGEAMEADPDVLEVRLWRGKRTLVHRRMWPALVRIGTARTPWQVTGLSPAARRTLGRIERDAARPRDPGPSGFAEGTRESGFAIRELESRLLVLTRSVHTILGAHTLEAKSWGRWSREARVPRFTGSVANAQTEIEEASARLSPGMDARHAFPWGRLGRGPPYASPAP